MMNKQRHVDFIRKVLKESKVNHSDGELSLLLLKRKGISVSREAIKKIRQRMGIKKDRGGRVVDRQV